MTVETAAENLFRNYGKLSGVSLEEYKRLVADGCTKCDMKPQAIYNGLRLCLGLEYGQMEYFSEADARELLGVDQQGLYDEMRKAGVQLQQTESKTYFFPNGLK